MTSYWFNDVGRALEFAEKHGTLVKGDGTVGWTVEWDGTDTEPPSAFERIVSRNGGEGKVDAPAEIVQRLKVRSVGEESDDLFYVCLGSPGQERGAVFIPISQADTSRFKVGSIIEVVLRPAPLA